LEPTSGAAHVAWSPDGQFLATAGGAGGGIRIWAVPSFSPIFTLPSNGTTVTALAWADTPPNIRATGAPRSFIAAGDLSGTITIWDPDARKVVKSLPLSAARRIVESVRFSRDGKYLAAQSYDGIARAWSTATWQQTMNWDHRSELAEAQVDIAPDSRTVASSGFAGACFLDAATGEPLARVRKARPVPLARRCLAHDRRRPAAVPRRAERPTADRV
jgi:WD40 repeat protein